MATRTNSQQVTFRRPFLLSGFETIAPAGTYTVDTEEEQIDTLTVSAWKRIATVMQLTRDGAVEYWPVDPRELHEALMRDGAQPDPSMPPSVLPNSRHKRARDALNGLRTHGKRY